MTILKNMPQDNVHNQDSLSTSVIANNEMEIPQDLDSMNGASFFPANGFAPTIAEAVTPTNNDDDTMSATLDAANAHYRKLRKTTSHAESSGKVANGMGARTLSMNRTLSYAPSLSGFSHHSTDHDHLIPPPSSPKEKSKHTRRYMASVCAIMWAIFLVIWALIIFIGGAIFDIYPLVQASLIAILSASLIFFVFLYINVRTHVVKSKRTNKERLRRQQLYAEYLASLQTSVNEDQLITDASDEKIVEVLHLPPLPSVPHSYCFMTGRHGEFMYLKFGAAWFALGLLIHSILQISYQIIFLTGTDQQFYECASGSMLALEIIFPIHSFVVLFFIFKYINVIINVYRGLARIMLMHAIGTSLAMWIYTIVSETVGAIKIAELYENIIQPDVCTGPVTMNIIHQNISPYLYPFVIEFCILVVGIFYMIWANISHCPKKFSAMGHDHGGHHHENAAFEHQESPEPTDVTNGSVGLSMNKANGQTGPPTSASSMTGSSDHCETTAKHENDYKNQLFLYADCSASSRGLFAGLILIILTIVFIVLFFIAVQDRYNYDALYAGVLVNSIFEVTVFTVLIVAVIAAYFQTAKLDINHHPMSMLDDVLLFIAIPAFFLETIFRFIPAIYNTSILNMFIILTQLIQILIQTPFIIDGLRRCANAAHLRKNKPGRELIMFLTIANVSLWIFLTFSVKTEYTADERYDFYGYTLWSILNHISLPLIMFYRFHASVCLVDMWKHSYEPEPPAH